MTTDSEVKEFQRLGYLDQDQYISNKFDYSGNFNLLSDAKNNTDLKNFLQRNIFEIVV
jgi:hypothetical protein